jgi:D-proline reductase (dithiol) PrdB
LRQIKDKYIAKLLTKYPTLFERWARNADVVEFSDTPWTPFDGEVSRSRIALITTGGVHLSTQQPFNMKDPFGDHSFREIPSDAAAENLFITHNYYDHSDADKDINIVFPLERLQYLKHNEEVGGVNFRHFSFMGHIKHDHIDVLIKDTAPRVAAVLKSDGVDIAILTPA